MTFDAAGSSETSMSSETAPATITAVPAPNPITPPKPQQEAPVIQESAAMAPIAAAPVAPAVPTAIPADAKLDMKGTEFLYHVASVLRDYEGMGKTEAEAVGNLLQQQNALIAALNPHGDVEKASATALTTELNVQMANDGCHIPNEESEKTMHGIFTKRQAEASAALKLLSDKAFMEQAAALAKSGQSLVPPHWFNGEKKEEIIKELAADVPAHTLANGIGQHFLHKALAQVWKMDGPLEKPLVAAIRQAMPESCPDAIIGLARGWLHDRYHRADVVANEVKPGHGSLYAEAMKRSVANIHPKKETAPASVAKEETAAATETPAVEVPVAQSKTALPAVQASVPAEHAGMVQAAQTQQMATAAPAL